MLRRYRDFLIDAADEVADTLVSETGKPRADAYGGELFFVCDSIGYWSRNAARILAPSSPRLHLLKSKKAYSTYKPRGVVGVVAPWNFPLILTVGEAVPALMAGNAVVIKPSELTPLTTLLACRIAVEAGLPADLLACVTGNGSVGAELVEHADMIAFTGSTETGRKIAVRAAELLKPVSLELGGKDPMIVRRDADLDRAAAGCVWGALANTGQVCMSVERVYVHQAVYERFVDKVVEQVGRVRQGEPAADVDIGAVASQEQLDKIAAHVDDARQRGARVLAGGEAVAGEKGYWYPPTVVADVPDASLLMRDETFGPVIALAAVDSDDEAVDKANASRYGLSASVWSRDRRAATELGRAIDTGAVCVNDHMVHMGIPEVPTGGVADSGLGRRHGDEGLRKFCDQQTVVVDRFGLKREPQWFPVPKHSADRMRRVLRVLFRSGLRNKLGG